MPLGFGQTKICNMALSHVGSKTQIDDIDEVNPAAKQCKLWWDTARYATLEAFDWSFARRTKLMATHAEDAPENRWAFRYQLPADCVAPRFIENPAGPTADAVPFEKENAGDGTISILTDMEDAILVYTFDHNLIAQWSVHFCETVALGLGIRISYKLSGKKSVRDSVTKAFNEYLDRAYLSDGSSLVPRGERDAAAIRARV